MFSYSPLSSCAACQFCGVHRTTFFTSYHRDPRFKGPLFPPHLAAMSIFESSFSNPPRLGLRLPAELWLRACRHLGQADLLSASRVSAALRAYTLNDSALWSIYSGCIAWERRTGCQCEVFGGHRHPDRPGNEDSAIIAIGTPASSIPWPYSFTRAYEEMKLFVERSASRSFHLSLDIWCGLNMHPELLSALIDLITSDGLHSRLFSLSLMSSNKATIAALLDRALRNTTHLHDVTIDLRESSLHYTGHIDHGIPNTGELFAPIAPFLSGSLTTSTLVYWWAESTPTPFARLSILRTSFVGALMFAEIPNIWPEVVEVVADFDDDSLQDAADPAKVVKALRQLKRLVVIVYAQAFQPLSQGLLYPGETRHMESLTVLVQLSDPRPGRLFVLSLNQGLLENMAVEEIQNVGEELRDLILQLLGEVSLETSSRDTWTPDVELTIGRLEPDDSGMRNQPMNVVRAQCKQTGRVRSVGHCDSERWPISSFITRVAPAIWHALGGKNGAEVALVTELVVPAECLSDLLRQATPQSVSRIRHLTVEFMVNCLEGVSPDVVLPELPALRTLVLTARDGRSYSFAEVERIIRPIVLAASSALEQVQLLLERTAWTADELGRAKGFASRVVYLPQSVDLSSL